MTQEHKDDIVNIDDKPNQNFLRSIKESEPDFVLSWLSGLTDLEQKIVSNLYQRNHSLSIRQIRTTIIAATIFHNNPKYVFPFDSFYLLSSAQRIKLRSIEKLIDQIQYVEEVIKIPSFKKIERTLTTLKSLGIINSRPSEDKKIKGLFFLNPFIRTKLNKLKDE